MNQEAGPAGPDSTAEEGILLRIYLAETDRWQGKPLHEAIVAWARSFGVAGATVLWGIEGFGRSRKVHTTRILQLSYDLPVVVEVADRAERIRELSEQLRPMVEGKVVTWERLRILNRLYPSVERQEQPRPPALD